MSAHEHAPEHEEGLIHGDAPHGSLKDYVVGFILSAILTAIPFYLEMGDVALSKTTIAFVIMGFAAVDMIVHMV